MLSGMNFLHRHGVTLLVLAAIFGSFLVNRQESIDRNNEQSQTLVAGCITSNTARALLAAYQRRTVANARTPAIAADYAAFARGGEDFLTVAKYIDDPTAATQVEVFVEDGKAIMRLTDASAALVRDACEQFYG